MCASDKLRDRYRRRLRNLEVAGKDIEHAAHICCALNVRVATQSINATTGASDIAQQQLQDCGGANDLRAGGMLRPTDGVDDRGSLLHVAVLANGREHVGGFQELLLRNARDAFNHFGRVARVLFLQQLKDTSVRAVAKDRKPCSAAALAVALVHLGPLHLVRPAA